MVNRLPHGGERGPGRPATRWEDALDSFGKANSFKWQEMARDRRAWDSWELVGKSRWTGRLAFLKSHYFDHRRSPAVLTTPAKAN